MSGFNVSSTQSLMLLASLSQAFPVVLAENSTQSSRFFSSTNSMTSSQESSLDTASSVALTLALAIVTACLFYALCKMCGDEFRKDQVTEPADDPDYSDALTDTEEATAQRSSAIQMV